MSKKFSNWKKQITTRASLAPEAAGSTRLTMIDNTSVYVENHHGVVEYTAKRVALRVDRAHIVIGGANLVLERFDNGIAEVAGEIASIQFEKTAYEDGARR